MNSGRAPQATRSSTTIATRSMPTVPCTPIAWATATFVPTPSVEVASRGRRIPVRAEASTSPANPPAPSTTGHADATPAWVLRTAAFIRVTARSPASVSTPAAA